MVNNYTPHPLNTADVRLPESLDELMEQLARNVHEVWAAGRIADGWKWGEVRDDEQKLHPCLVAYEELPESEKDYDRRTALETLKTIVKLGYTIDKQEV